MQESETNFSCVKNLREYDCGKRFRLLHEVFRNITRMTTFIIGCLEFKYNKGGQTEKVSSRANVQ